MKFSILQEVESEFQRPETEKGVALVTTVLPQQLVSELPLRQLEELRIPLVSAPHVTRMYLHNSIGAIKTEERSEPTVIVGALYEGDVFSVQTQPYVQRLV